MTRWAAVLLSVLLAVFGPASCGLPVAWAEDPTPTPTASQTSGSASPDPTASAVDPSSSASPSVTDVPSSSSPSPSATPVVRLADPVAADVSLGLQLVVFLLSALLVGSWGSRRD